MTNYLIQICWNQKNRYQDIKDYYNLIKKTCTKTEGVDLFGLYKPLTEDWHWSYLLYLDNLEKWQKIEEEIESNNPAMRENIHQKITRIYVEREKTMRPNNIESLKYLEIELVIWEGINAGISEYYNSLTQVFSGKKDVWFMGQYAPANENYNWAHFYMYESLTRMTEMDFESGRKMGRPYRHKFVVERLYKLFDPKEQ